MKTNQHSNDAMCRGHRPTGGLCRHVRAGPMRWLLADIYAGEIAVYRMSFDEFPQLKNSHGSVRLNVLASRARATRSW